MLIISRKKTEKIIVSDDIEITILEVGRNRVRFGINAPKGVTIQTHIKELPPATEAVAPPSDDAVEPPLAARAAASGSS